MGNPTIKDIDVDVTGLELLKKVGGRAQLDPRMDDPKSRRHQSLYREDNNIYIQVITNGNH